MEYVTVKNIPVHRPTVAPTSPIANTEAIGTRETYALIREAVTVQALDQMEGREKHPHTTGMTISGPADGERLQQIPSLKKVGLEKKHLK